MKKGDNVLKMLLNSSSIHLERIILKKQKKKNKNNDEEHMTLFSLTYFA